MAPVYAADGGDGLQIRKEILNTMNKKLQIAEKEWSTSFGDWVRASNTSQQD
jgi:hypothetical protein